MEKVVEMVPPGTTWTSMKATPGSVATGSPPLRSMPLVRLKGVASLHEAGLTGPAAPTNPPAAAWRLATWCIPSRLVLFTAGMLGTTPRSTGIMGMLVMPTGAPVELLVAVPNPAPEPVPDGKPEPLAEGLDGPADPVTEGLDEPLADSEAEPVGAGPPVALLVFAEPVADPVGMDELPNGAENGSEEVAVADSVLSVTGSELAVRGSELAVGGSVLAVMVVEVDVSLLEVISTASAAFLAKMMLMKLSRLTSHRFWVGLPLQPDLESSSLDDKSASMLPQKQVPLLSAESVRLTPAQ
jgi:hypothetical protein